MGEVANSGGEQNATSQEGQQSSEGQTQQQPSYDERIKAIAAKAGWKETGPMDAEEFLATMPDRFRDKGKELKDLKRSVDAIKGTFEKAQEISHRKGVEEATQRLQAAKEALDPDAIEQATRALEQAKVNKPTVADHLSEEAEEFVNNPALDKDPGMLAEAMDYREKYLRANPGDINGALLYARKKMSKEYPDVFGGEQRKEERQPEKKPPAGGVEGVRGGGNATPQWQRDKEIMSDVEKAMMKTFTGQIGRDGKPVMNEQQYIESLRAQGAFQGRGK